MLSTTTPRLALNKFAQSNNISALGLEDRAIRGPSGRLLFPLGCLALILSNFQEETALKKIFFNLISRKVSDPSFLPTEVSVETLIAPEALDGSNVGKRGQPFEVLNDLVTL